MQKSCLVFVFCLSYYISVSAGSTPPRKMPGKAANPIELAEIIVRPGVLLDYKPSDKRIWDLLHTRLELIPSFSTRQIKGKATLLLTPYAMPQKKLVLDAVNFSDLSTGILLNGTLTGVESSYDQNELSIELPGVYAPGDTLQLEIAYTTNTYTMDQGTLELYNGRGAYFIDPFDKNPYKPAQLWTQGETRTSRCWFPTIDSPAERCSQELFVTVDSSYISLSNGLLMSSIHNPDGSRTDYWRQDLEHPPYLFSLVVGDFVKVREEDWRGKEIAYYTIPGFEANVKKVFRNTSRMLDFFSGKLGVSYPWDKYSQIIVYDYTAGAMENTSSSLYYEPLYATEADLIDDDFEDVISHELIHQWFGDLLNIESWANLAMKESFADFGESLWYEYALGPYGSAYKLWRNLHYYLYDEENDRQPIINYYYDKPQDLYDNIRYEKGGYVMQMLRRYMGDPLFFRGMQKYIIDNAFKPVEIHDFRKAMEAVSGEDLNWFFNQWFLQAGHPDLKFTTVYDAEKKVVSVDLVQEQVASGKGVFRFPLAMDIYTASGVKHQFVNVSQEKHTFYFSSPEKPLLVNVDADKTLLCTRKENKSISDWITQYKLAPLFGDKMEALEQLNKQKKNEAKITNSFLSEVLSDSFWVFRKYALRYIDINAVPEETTDKISFMARKDPHPDIRKSALEKLSMFDRSKFAAIFEEIWEQDSSPVVLAATLQILMQVHKEKVLGYASRFDGTMNKSMLQALGKVYAKYGGSDQLEVMNKTLWLSSQARAESSVNHYFDYLIRQDVATFTAGVNVLSDINLFEETASTANLAGTTIQRLAKKVIEKLEDVKPGSYDYKDWEAKKSVLSKFAIEK